jgi:hypothetical protein
MPCAMPKTKTNAMPQAKAIAKTAVKSSMKNLAKTKLMTKAWTNASLRGAHLYSQGHLSWGLQMVSGS